MATLLRPIAVRPLKDAQTFAPYLPVLSESSASGWMDIVCLASMIILSDALDCCEYLHGIPEVDIQQRVYVRAMYRRWRRWFVVKFVGRRGSEVIDWEVDVFSVSFNNFRLRPANSGTQPMLLHLAHTVLQYHRLEAGVKANSDSEALISLKFPVVNAKMVDALESYSPGLGSKLESYVPDHSRFWLFTGDEFVVNALF
jgi:hypothetical protein